MPGDGIHVIIYLIIDEGIADCIEVFGAGRDSEDIPDVVVAAFGSVGKILLVGIVRVNDCIAVVAFLVPFDGICWRFMKKKGRISLAM